MNGSSVALSLAWNNHPGTITKGRDDRRAVIEQRFVISRGARIIAAHCLAVL